MWMIHTFISKVLSVLFPAHCYKCQKEGESLCAECLHLCKEPLNTPALYILSAFCFKDPLVKKAIHAIKYFNRQDLIPPLTQKLAEKIIMLTENFEPSQNWVIIPVPMPRFRKLIRGYNQAELIAKELSNICSFPVDTKSLIRSHSPKRQVTTKTRGERLRNQHNSFKVTSGVENMHIILVDDVTTTGATLSEARLALLKSGAHVVKAATLAH